MSKELGLRLSLVAACRPFQGLRKQLALLLLCWSNGAAKGYALRARACFGSTPDGLTRPLRWLAGRNSCRLVQGHHVCTGLFACAISGELPLGRPLQQPHPVPFSLLGAEVMHLGIRWEGEGTDCTRLPHHAGGREDDGNVGSWEGGRRGVEFGTGAWTCIDIGPTSPFYEATTVIVVNPIGGHPLTLG